MKSRHHQIFIFNTLNICHAFVIMIDSTTLESNGIFVDKDSGFPVPVHGLGTNVQRRLSLQTLPDIELGYIFDYLHWRDKLNFLEACPEVDRIINSPLGWWMFQANERFSINSLEDELACIWKYGHLFQHCRLWLGQPCTSSGQCTCLVDHLMLNVDKVFPILEAASENCCSLKSLRLYHPSHGDQIKRCRQSCDTEIFKQYQHCIEKLYRTAAQDKRFRLELFGLQYSHDHILPVALRFLDYFIANPQILQLVTVLDIARVTDSRLQPRSPLTFLKSMILLKVLRVPIHCIDMDIVQYLVQNSLQHLYLLSDYSTVDHEFEEHDRLHWEDLVVPSTKSFAVHYIFKQRVLNENNFVDNPYVKTVCFDSLCSPVTEDLVTAVANQYGKTLKLFCLTHSLWAPKIHISDFSDFAARCSCLTHFITTVTLPGPLLVALVQNSPSIKEVLVASQNNEELSGIIPAMSLCLKKEWQPRHSLQTFHVDFCEMSFLMNEVVSGTG